MKAKRPPLPKYKVRWFNPETRRWEDYQTGLSLRRATTLASDLRYGFGARWFDHNPATEVVRE